VRFLIGAATLAVLTLGGWAIARRRLVVVRVEGISMTPTYKPGDRVLVRRCTADKVRRGQVVVIERPEEGTGWSNLPPLDGRLAGRRWYIKRAAAVPGEPAPRAVLEALGISDTAVPAGELVVLGDNPRSDDSRRWGYVPGERVLGVVIRRMTPVHGRSDF
jgi:signal peptidase I